jgi:hydrogenase expression/formation protein HypE
MSSRLDFSAACPLPIRERREILLGHGSGGLLTSELIESTILPAFRNPALEALDDQALLTLDGGLCVAFTTDSYVVTPLFFPGGDIGELAVNGTINDLAMGGAKPLALSLAFILEEGFALDEFERVLACTAAAARRAGVPVVTGDTKVVGKGSGDAVFINTSGIGLVQGRRLGSALIRPGDAVLVSGTLGDHGMAVLACREGLAVTGDLRSDTAPLHELSAALLAACPSTHALRDPTRGGLAAVLHEIAARQRLGIEVDEASLPVSDAVRGASELFGIEPIYIANEGKLVAFVPEAEAGRALDTLRAHPLGRHAARVGTVTHEHAGSVVLVNPIGGRRVLDLPLTEPLPRIC